MNLFFRVMVEAKENGPIREQISILQGPEMVISHFVHPFQSPDDCNSGTDDTPVIITWQSCMIVFFTTVVHWFEHEKEVSTC